MNQLLVIDVGNTNITVGIFQNDDLLMIGRLSTDVARTDDETALLISGLITSKGITHQEISHVAMCSVVPPITTKVFSAVEKLTGVTPMLVGPGIKTGIRVNYDRTQDVGTDRIVDAVAALTVYGGPAIVVDIGTATVFDAITSEGEYLGGAIAPGIEMAADALYTGASQLRRIELKVPETSIGRSTIASIQSGLIFGYVELIEGMIRRFKNELNVESGDECNVIGTGGMAWLINPLTKAFDHYDPELTLRGLRLVYEMNCD